MSGLTLSGSKVLSRHTTRHSTPVMSEAMTEAMMKAINQDRRTEMGELDYIDIRVSFARSEEDEEVYYWPVSVEFVESSILSDHCEQIAEAAFQSEVYTVGVTNATLSALGGEKTYV